MRTVVPTHMVGVLLIGLLAGLVLALYLAYLLLQARPVARHPAAAGWMGVPGLALTAWFLAAYPLSLHGWIFFIAELLLNAGLLGAVRAATARVWLEGPVVMERGGGGTVALWMLGFLAHLLLEGVGALGAASVLLYLGATWAVQHYLTAARGTGLRAAGPP